MGCSVSKGGISEGCSIEKSPPSTNTGSGSSTPSSVPILEPVPGARMRSSCPSTPDAATSMIILPLFPGRVSPPEVRSTPSSRRTTPPGQMGGHVPENVVIVDHRGPLLAHKINKLVSGNGSDPLLQHSAHSMTTRTAEDRGDADYRSAPSQSLSSHGGSRGDRSPPQLMRSRNTTPKSASAIQQTVTAALNSAGYVVVHAPSPPGSGTATPVHPLLRKPAAGASPSPDSTSRSPNLAIMHHMPKNLPASGGPVMTNGAPTRGPAGTITPASSRHTSRSSSPSSSPSLDPKKPRHPKKVPLPSSSHYRHSHRYRKPAFSIPQNANTVRYANLDHSSVLSFSNLDSVRSFTTSDEAGKQTVLKDATVQNANVSGGALHTGIHQGNSRKQPREVVVINGSAVYMTSADGTKLGAYHQPSAPSAPSAPPEEEIKQLKPKVPIPVAVPIDGHSQLFNAGDARTALSTLQVVPRIQGPPAHNSLLFKPYSSATSIPVTQVGGAPTRLPIDLSSEAMSESSRVSSSNSNNVVDHGSMAAAFQEMLGRTDPLMASSWATTPDRENLLEANITQKVLQECRSLEAKLGYFDGDDMLSPIEIEDENMSFRSDSTNGDLATYKHLCA